MSTRDRSVESWPCPCGAGELQFHTSTPDHPWNPTTSLDAVVWTCSKCERDFGYESEPQFTGSRLAGSPAYSSDKERILYFRKADSEPRQSARMEVAQADTARSKLRQRAEDAVVASLAAVSGSRRHRLAAEILGFATATEAKVFIARRHVPTFVAEAMRDARTLRSAAGYFDMLEQLDAAESALAQAKVKVASLGPVPMHSYRERESTTAMLRRILK